jgi:hypothetical protein
MPLMNIYASDATYVSDRNQLKNYSNSDLLIAGNDKQYINSKVILLKFGKLTSFIDYDIKRATLWLYVNKNSAFNDNRNSHAFIIYPNLTDFNAGSVIWNNRPYISSVPLASMKIRKSDFGSYVQCHITDLVRDWLTKPNSNYGITLAAPYYCNNVCFSIHSNINSNPPIILLEYAEKNKILKDDGKHYENVISNFDERIFFMHVKDSCVFTPNIEIAKSRTVSFFVKNLGPTSIEVVLQISPDGINFIDNPQMVTLPAQEITALTPYMFARYIKIGVKNNDPCTCTDVKVWYQAQMLNYTIK